MYHKAACGRLYCCMQCSYFKHYVVLLLPVGIPLQAPHAKYLSWTAANATSTKQTLLLVELGVFVGFIMSSFVCPNAK